MHLSKDEPHGARSHHSPKTNITADELNLLPLKAFSGKVSVITESTRLSGVLREIERHDVVGFDTETRPSFKRGQIYNVALLQLAIPNKVFLIRMHQTGLPEEIISIFQNDDIIKAGVAIRDDIKALQKINRFQPASFIELSAMARASGLQVESVKKLAGLLLGFRISKSAQTSNWEAPTLTEKQLEYAATDAWVCLEIYRHLKHKYLHV
ncbi:MAG: 3'-5' exonuclease domain-containing protein 2 [Cyclobacteriaceae bacterium]|nr:3'-5' exonuclease domain-containing protein 2 [Cyclobacteriaceae bacterium]MDH4294760.1 3'-5' exonuclease domain-containing protein 2 [Cyclobacteriaceae bacterium]MDH5248609.1 3'-5' exonuclease domain-containing protein 2 [Cyclobacteriaceae bacterium]